MARRQDPPNEDTTKPDHPTGLTQTYHNSRVKDAKREICELRSPCPPWPRQGMVVGDRLARGVCASYATSTMKVRDCVTTQVITVTPETSTREAFRLMKTRHIRHLPVVKQGVILGIVTDRDLRRPQASDVFKSWDELYRLGDDIKVEDVMVSPVLTIDAQADIREAAQKMVRYRIGALPVTDAHHGLAGIVTETDLLRALISLAPEA